MTYVQPSADDFLLGGGSKSASFKEIGKTVAGVISQKPEMRQQKDIETGELKVWKDGNPQMQLVVTLKTLERDASDPEDDGTRALYLKGNLKNAVASAVRLAKATGLQVGGVLQVTFSGEGEKTNKAYNAPKLYTAVYVPPKEPVVDVETGQNVAQAPTPPPAAAAPAAPTPPPAAPVSAATPEGLSADAAAALAALLPS